MYLCREVLTLQNSNYENNGHSGYFSVAGLRDLVQLLAEIAEEMEATADDRDPNSTEAIEMET